MVQKALGYDITNMTLVAFAGIVIKLFLGGSYSEDGSSGPAGAAMWGYGLVSIALLTIMVISFGLTSRMAKVQELSTIAFVKALFMHSLPSLLLLGILVWIIYLNAAYYKRINQNKVASEYANYSTVSTVLIIIQIIVLFKYLVDELKIGEGGSEAKLDIEQALKSKLASVTYLVSLGNIMLAAIMNIILEFFSTDG
uniref:Uncharacterized protein n=1 Tax=viral metagenome TaxID=1070528 RepID=A0A6C0CP61_9ZZZZ